MYRILKHKYDDRDKLFFSSDWHIFHNPSWDVPIWKTRGYLSASDAAEQILNTINARVSEHDTLYFLGDGFLNASDEEVIRWLSRINCKNIQYLFGNHCSNMYRLYTQEVERQYGDIGVEVYPLRMNNVVFLGNHIELHVGKQRIIMNHFPLHSFHKMKGGSIMLSGHSHNTDKSRNPDWPTNRCLDIGWDWKRDVWSFEEIMDVMSTKTFTPVDHQ